MSKPAASDISPLRLGHGTPQEEKPPLLAGLARNASAQFVARLLGVSAQGVGLILAARHLGPATYGGFALVSTLTLMANVVADWGLLLTGARAAAMDRESTGTVLRGVLTLRMGLGALAAALVIALAHVASPDGTVHTAALIAGASLLLGTPFAVGQVRAQLDLRMERAALAALAGSTASLIWIVVALTLGGGIVALSGALAVAAAVSSAVCAVLTPGGLPLLPGGDSKLRRRLLHEAHPIGVGYLLVAVYFYIDAVMLARLSTSEQLGLYDAAYRFVQVGLLVPWVLVSSIYTLAVEAASPARERMEELAREFLSVVALFVPIPLILLATAPEPLIVLLYGEAYRDSGPLLALLAVAIALVICSGVIGPLLVAVGRERATLAIAGVAVPVNVTANLLLIPSLGARGAAIATVLTEVAVFVPATVLLVRVVRLRFDGRHLVKVSLAGAAGAVAVLGLPGPVLLRLAAGLLVYVVALAATGAINRRQLELTRMAPSSAAGGP